MSVDVEQIDAWLALPSETRQLEFKEAKLQFDNTRLFKYCVAIANEGGGSLLLGVTDGKPRTVVGTQAFNNLVGMEAKLFASIGFRVEIAEVAHPDGRVLVFQIPSRLAGSAYASKGAYYMRVGEQLQPMSEDRLRAIFAEGKPDWLEQAAVDSASPQKVVALLDTQSFFDLLGQPYPSTQQAVLEKLVAEKLVSEQQGDFAISNLAAILLAKDIRKFDSVKRKAPRVIVYRGENKLDTESDTIGNKGYAVGFQALVGFVMAKLPQNEVIENALRTESKLLPEVVIRELLANALVHQDFEKSGMSPMVEIYEGRIEISNPGEPLVPIERLIDGYESRNERLADLMRRFGICEEKGSGIDRTIDAAETFQLPAPDFRVEQERMLVILHGPRPFKKMDREDRMRACYQHCALQWMQRKAMTNQSLRNRFKLSPSSTNTVSVIIASAIEANRIKPDPSAPSSKKYARYLPIWA
jgi:predicted HTH transcriptional regulator